MRTDTLPDPACDGFVTLGITPRHLAGLLGLSLMT